MRSPYTVVSVLFLLLVVTVVSVITPRPALAATITIGQTTVLSSVDSGNANLLLAQQATLSQAATIQSLSFYVKTASGNLRLGIYDATGPGGGPGALKAQSNSFTPVAGWNTQNVVTPVSLPAGNYWLAYLPSSNSLSFVKQNNTGPCYYYGFTFGALPSTFSTSPASCTATTWSFYASLNTSASGPTISAIASSTIMTGATITWTTSTSSNSKVVYGLTTSYGAASSSSALITSHSIALTGLATSTTYHFAVVSADSQGNTSTSTDQTFTTTTPAAPVISAIAATSTANTATITWTTSTSSNSKVVYGLTSSYGSASSSAPLVTTHSIGLQGLSASTTYHFAVVSMTPLGAVATSSDQTFTTQSSSDTTPPSIPANLSATGISVSQIQLSWATSTDNVGVAGYNVFRNGTHIATTTAPAYTDSSLTPHTTYTYTVSAFDAAGNTSAQSTPAQGTTLPDTTPPSIPANLAASNVTSTGATISWSASTDNVGVAGYFVYRGGVQIATTTATSYSDATLLASTTYAYTVSAFDASGNVSAQSSPVNVTTASQSSGVPTLIQHVASSANPVGLGISGNNFKIPLPNAVGAGNTLILGITYPSGSTPTITDSNGNTWPSTPAVTADPGSGGYASSIFVLSNANSGITTVTVSFPSAVIPFEYTLSEFDNVATVSPVSGTSASTNNTGPSLSSGLFTPANNDGNGGNLIWSYYALSQNAHGNPSDWSAGNGDTLLDGDIAWTDDQGFPHASEYVIQPTDAAINPSITATSDSSDDYNAISVALKAASAGSAASSGIHINKIIHQSTSPWPASGSYVLQAPTTGNLLVMEDSDQDAAGITSITDSDGDTWNQLSSNAVPGIWWSANRTPDPNLTVTLHLSGSNATESVRFLDISDAAASPLDTSASTNEIGVSNQTVVNDHPDFTPSAPNELVIAAMDLGQGPGLGFASGAPSGAVWDFVTYTGEIDTDLMENADGVAHLYNTTTATEDWNWSITSQPSNSSSGVALAFKAASSSTSTPTATLSASPSSITSGSASTLTWSSTNATSCTGTNFTPSGTSGSTSVSPTVTTSYSITCTGAGGTSSPANATVTVGDTTPPSTPTNLAATAVSSSAINLSWTASTDNVGVTGYKIYRSGTQIGTSATNSYGDTGLTASTQYTYTVSAYDAAGNNSAQSSSASATTQASGGGGGSIAYIQTVKTLNDSGTASFTSNSITTSGGDTLVVALALWSGVSDPPTISSITLDGTTNFTVNKTEVVSNNQQTIVLASLPNVPAGTHTITVTATGAISVGSALFASEFSGLPTAPVDGSGAAAAGYGTNPSSGAFTTTASNDLWVSAFVGNVATASVTPAAGWTVPTNGTNLTDGGVGYPVAGFEYEIANNQTSGTGSFTLTASPNWATAAAAYKAQ